MNRGYWHKNWFIDILLRLGFLVLITWVALTVALYLTGAGEPLCAEPAPYQPLPADPPADDLP